MVWLHSRIYGELLNISLWCYTILLLYLFLRELNFAKMEQVHISRGLISRFTQKCILKGTKFHENCQNTDLYQQTVSELAILWNPGTSTRFQGELPALPFWLEIDPQPLSLQGWELARLILIFHSSSFHHWTKSYFNKKEKEDLFICSFTRV